MAPTEKRNIYSICDPIVRTKPQHEADEQLCKEISSGYRLLPTFESTLFDKVFTKNHSLERNEFLKCRWSQYKRNIDSRVFAPFQFPDIRELHFYNCAIRIKPEASICNMDHRMKLIPGPGVDSRGLLPIPQEAMMKRGKTNRTNVKRQTSNPKKSAKNKRRH